MAKIGKIIWDEEADENFIKHAIKHNFEVQKISPADRDIGMSDTELQKKYGKGSYPIFTNDANSYRYHSDKGVIGYIVHEIVPKGEKYNKYSQKVEGFFKKLKIKECRNYRIKIPQGEKPIEKKKLKSKEI